MTRSPARLGLFGVYLRGGRRLQAVNRRSRDAITQTAGLAGAAADGQVLVASKAPLTATHARISRHPRT